MARKLKGGYVWSNIKEAAKGIRRKTPFNTINKTKKRTLKKSVKKRKRTYGNKRRR